MQSGGSRDVVVVAFGMWYMYVVWCLCVVHGFYVVCMCGMHVMHIWVCHEYVYVGYVVDM